MLQSCVMFVSIVEQQQSTLSEPTPCSTTSTSPPNPSRDWQSTGGYNTKATECGIAAISPVHRSNDVVGSSVPTSAARGSPNCIVITGSVENSSPCASTDFAMGDGTSHSETESESSAQEAVKALVTGHEGTDHSMSAGSSVVATSAGTDTSASPTLKSPYSCDDDAKSTSVKDTQNDSYVRHPDDAQADSRLRHPCVTQTDSHLRHPSANGHCLHVHANDSSSNSSHDSVESQTDRDASSTSSSTKYDADAGESQTDRNASSTSSRTKSGADAVNRSSSDVTSLSRSDQHLYENSNTKHKDERKKKKRKRQSTKRGAFSFVL